MQIILVEENLRQDSKDILARFSGPTLVVVGRHDTLTPSAKAQQMTDLISGAKLVQLPKAGHLAHLEAPDAFNAAVDDFLSRIAAG